MVLGMPTLIELNNLSECAKLCNELELQFVELNMNLPEYQEDKIDAERFAQTAHQYGVFYTIHFDEKLNPFDLTVKWRLHILTQF